MERSKISVTPSSPMQSPRYSLLVGDTSSENSSAVNTPQYDLEPLMATSAMSGLSAHSGASSHLQQQPLLLGVDNNSCLGTSHESLGSNFTSHSNITNASHPERRDMHALKRELSLDLQPLSTKMTIDGVDGGAGNGNAGHAATLPYNRQRELAQQLIPSPNNSNFTDNTSQSVTPSEFGYQNLQRQSSMHSLIETEAESPAYEEYENTPSNMTSPLLGAQKPPPIGGPTSPIRATISITYNMRSPRGDELQTNKPFVVMREKTKAKGPLLETSFDENTVYEQVRFFRNSVTEVNQLLSDERKSSLTLESLKETNENEDFSAYENVPLLGDERQASRKNKASRRCGRTDVPMSGDTNILDSLEEPSEDERLLYENVELRKPKSVYANILGEQLKSTAEANAAKLDATSDKVDLDSLDSLKTDTDLTKVECAELIDVNTPAREHEPPHSAGLVESAARKSPSNFSVKELATKFESSPVEQLPAFDFSFRNSIKKHSTAVAELKASQTSLTSNAEQTATKDATNPKQKLTKSQQITRSLDENAFVREFGSKQLQELSTRSTQQLPELAEVMNRRKSFDFTRPKTLNPPKRLPGIPITEEVCLSKSEKSSPPAALKLEKSHNRCAADAALENDYETAELKITPTTENRISLIQNNVNSSAAGGAASAAAINASASDLSNSNLNLSTSSLKVLSGVKLDRERIDKIKEERRQQLTQKYRGDTTNFKSRSKTDLHTSSHKDDDKFNAPESLRVKSKSRGDMRALQQENENVKELLGRARLLAGSESTLHSPRVRSISDEKNQNCDANTTAKTITVTATAVNNCNATNANAPNTVLANTTMDMANMTVSAVAAKKIPMQEEYSARATVQKFERKSFELANGTMGSGAVSATARERNSRGNELIGGSNSGAGGVGAVAVLSTSRQSLTST
ncbi:unnamed protein product, partial [Ceratitis capitata]